MRGRKNDSLSCLSCLVGFLLRRDKSGLKLSNSAVFFVYILVFFDLFCLFSLNLARNTRKLSLGFCRALDLG